MQIDLTGTWSAIADERRKLVFLPSGSGYIEVQGQRFPYFGWSSNELGLKWCFFKDAERTSVLAVEHEIQCGESVVGGERTLVFRVAPIPFGFKEFRYAGDA